MIERELRAAVVRQESARAAIERAARLAEAGGIDEDQAAALRWAESRARTLLDALAELRDEITAGV